MVKSWMTMFLLVFVCLLPKCNVSNEPSVVKLEERIYWMCIYNG